MSFYECFLNENDVFIRLTFFNLEVNSQVIVNDMFVFFCVSLWSMIRTQVIQIRQQKFTLLYFKARNNRLLCFFIFYRMYFIIYQYDFYCKYFLCRFLAHRGFFVLLMRYHRFSYPLDVFKMYIIFNIKVNKYSLNDTFTQ